LVLQTNIASVLLGVPATCSKHSTAALQKMMFQSMQMSVTADDRTASYVNI